MKRRGFLSLLGLAPVAPLIAKELSRSAEPTLPTQAKAPTPTPQSGIWQLQPLDASKEAWQGVSPADAVCCELAPGGRPYIRDPTEDTRQIELTATFPCKPGGTMPHFSRVLLHGEPVLTMPTASADQVMIGTETVTIVQTVQIN